MQKKHFLSSIRSTSNKSWNENPRREQNVKIPHQRLKKHTHIHNTRILLSDRRSTRRSSSSAHIKYLSTKFFNIQYPPPHRPRLVNIFSPKEYAHSILLIKCKRKGENNKSRARARQTMNLIAATRRLSLVSRVVSNEANDYISLSLVIAYTRARALFSHRRINAFFIARPLSRR